MPNDLLVSSEEELIGRSRSTNPRPNKRRRKTSPTESSGSTTSDDSNLPIASAGEGESSDSGDRSEDDVQDDDNLAYFLAVLVWPCMLMSVPKTAE